jgi:hypothetical protein
VDDEPHLDRDHESAVIDEMIRPPVDDEDDGDEEEPES